MTPLANLLLKKSESRLFPHLEPLPKILAKCQFFEVSEIIPLMEMFANGLKKAGREAARAHYDERLFLPAPYTWMEWKPVEANRLGILMVDRSDGWAECHVISDIGLHRACFISLTADDVYTPDGNYVDWLLKPIDTRMNYGFCGHVLLAMINTPRVVGRHQHMPLRKIEERLGRALGVQGRYPLQAWTEIKLEIRPPQDLSEEPSKEAHLTGKKALHFCRAHLRLRNGSFEFVRSHWRGDASIGTKRSRYTVIPPRQTA